MMPPAWDSRRISLEICGASDNLTVPLPSSREPVAASGTSSQALPAAAAIGHWMFRRRTWLPLPFAVTVLALHVADARVRGLAAAGALLIIVGQGLRLWAVRHIGVISRTRSARVGPLVTSGPFTIVRNPIYLGNLCLWSGITCSAGVLWMLPVCWGLFFFHYHFMTRWEEHLLEAHYDQAYREYARQVPRWIPRWRRPSLPAGSAPYTWSEIFFSERGTLMALSLMVVLLSAS